MKVVIAIDSLKGSLSSIEAGNIIKDAVLNIKPHAHVIVKPLADGGEGTVDSLIEGLGGEKIPLTVTGPLGSKVNTYYGYIKDTSTAVIEMASAAGITLVPEKDKDPLQATTYGVGEMIRHAINLGCQNFIIGIGGSATNDGGLGMLKALGWEFFDKNGEDVGEGGQALSKIDVICTDNVYKPVYSCSFKVACDVTNPLCGPNGATYIYGPQKGVSDDIRDSLDLAMEHYASMTEKYLSINAKDAAGAGAAGGMGYAFLSYLNAELTPGIELILNAIDLETEIKDADIVITGEGRLDHQTVMGKAPVGVAKLAKKYGKKVIAFAGSVTKDAAICNDIGIDAFFPIIREIITLQEAMKPEVAAENMKATVEQVFRLL